MWLVHTNLRWLVLTSRGTEKIVLGACGSVLRIICISFPFVTNNDFNQHKCVCKNGSDSRSTANNKRLGVVAAWRSFQELNFCSVFDQTVVGRRHVEDRPGQSNNSLVYNSAIALLCAVTITVTGSIIRYVQVVRADLLCILFDVAILSGWACIIKKQYCECKSL